MTFLHRSARYRQIAFLLLAVACVVGLSAAPTLAVVMGTATVSTTQTSAPYTYSITLHNTGTLAIDTLCSPGSTARKEPCRLPDRRQQYCN